MFSSDIAPAVSLDGVLLSMQSSGLQCGQQMGNTTSGDGRNRTHPAGTRTRRLAAKKAIGRNQPKEAVTTQNRGVASSILALAISESAS
jgi:hypothetical protein